MNPLRRHLTLGLIVLMVTLSVMAATGGAPPARAAVPTATTISEPPVAGDQILVFPQRDFVSASGYRGDEVVQVSVIHPNGVSYSTNGIVPQADPRAAANAPFAGIVEVNHPGGACWVGTTPDIRPGDQVRITITGSPDPARIGLADQTTVRDVTAARPVQTAPGSVQVHGTARDAAGAPLPVGELEHRLVANRDAFLLNGRRTLRASAAPNDGSVSYDAPGSVNWTATYSGLQPADVTRALGAESRVLWLPPVVAPAVATEGTIFENGAGAIAGPAVPCTAPLEKLPPPPGTELIPPTDPANLVAAVTNGNTVTLTWTASTDNVGVVDYGVYRDGIAIGNAQRPDGAAPAPATFVDRNVPPGTYTYTVDAGDAAGNRSNASNAASAATIRPVATLPVGTAFHEPPVAPVQIISFPSRDFVSSSGFLATDTVDVQLLRKQDGGLTIVSSAGGVIPQADPRAAPTDPFAGIVEVNHPGGACWDGTTPDIRVGDIIRTIARNPDGTIRAVDQTTTANVVAQRPFVVRQATGANSDGIVAVHGLAMDKDGNPLDLAQFESRLIANRDLYDFNHRRVIRAGGAGKDGTLLYDAADNPTGIKWTATYSGLDGDDVARVVGGTSTSTGRVFPGAESRALWLGVQPVAGLELTIYENSDATVNGPGAPCTALGEPLDKAPPTFPTGAPLHATQVVSTTNVQLSWDAASDDVAVYGYRIYRDGAPLKNVGAATTAYLDTNVVGDHTYTIDATDAASPGIDGNAQGTPYGNRSAQSDPASISAPDITAPSQPRNLVAIVNGAAHTVRLTWSASTDNVGVARYRVYRDGTLVGATADGTILTFTDAGPDGSGLTAATYTYTVDATDAALNASPQSASATVFVTAQPDNTAPSIPGGLATTVPDIHVKNVAITWTEATDDVGVTGYDLLRRQIGGQQVFSTIAQLNGGALSYTDANVPAGTYEYTVVAIDSAGNRSGQVNPAAQAVVANDPPLGAHSIIPFPARDFVSSTGYSIAEGPVTISVLRFVGGKWTSVVSSTPIAVAEDPATPGLGAVEVNHPGGGCWTTVTPNLVPGDVIRFVNKNGVADQTTVADVIAQRPEQAATKGTVIIRGIARDAAGLPLPVGQVESRLVANKDLFEINGRRVLRAGGAGSDGTLAYDASGSTRWTATFTGLSDNDVARAVGGTALSTGLTFVGAESRAVWLGRNPLALAELTIEENGVGVVGGPAGPNCTAPAETPAPAATLQAGGQAYADQAVGTTSAAHSFGLTNSGTAPLAVDRAYIAGMDTADFALSNDLCTGKTLAPGANCTVGVIFKPTAAGLRQANVSFGDNAANTTDQTVPLTGSGVTGNAPTAPGAPTNATATAGNGQATVTWTAPDANGGSPITGYTVISTPAGGTATVAGTVTGATVTGLTNGTAYTFTVTAANTVGTGPASAPSNSVTPAVLTVPGAPTGVTATVADTQATVSWTAPVSDGGSPITGYTVTATGGASPVIATVTAPAGSTTVPTSKTLTGLINGTTYSITVTATNSQGAGPASSPAVSVTPGVLAAPGAPTGATATAGNGQATVNWTAPASTGGSAIIRYTVTSSPAGGTATVTAPAGGTTVPTSATVTGLTNGIPYTFTVTASNTVGTSAPSVASNAVTPGPAILSVQSVTLSAGLITGGQRVTITGTNFQPGATVLFGAATATAVTFVNGTTITAVTPAHPAGVVDVTVTNPGNVSFTLAGAFNYVTAVAPLPATARGAAPPPGPGPAPAPVPAARPVTGAAPAIGNGGTGGPPPTR